MGSIFCFDLFLYNSNRPRTGSDELLAGRAGFNFMALLTASKESALTVAWNYTLTVAWNYTLTVAWNYTLNNKQITKD